MPVASCSSAALNSRYLAKLGSSTSTAGSGYRPNACGLAAATANAAPPVAIMVRLVGSMGGLLLSLFGVAQYRPGRTTEDRRRTTGRIEAHPSSVVGPPSSEPASPCRGYPKKIFENLGTEAPR